MLTREALRDSMAHAKADITRAPVDGMLAYLIALIEAEYDNWNQELAATVAIAYANAITKHGGRG